MTYDPSFANRAAEGLTSEIVAEIKRLVKDPLPTYSRWIVLEAVPDPYIIDDRKIDYWQNVLKVSNWNYSRILPRNTIIAQRIFTGLTSTETPMFLFPFFPSHLSLPCKPGEMVWVMFEDPNARIKDIGYWVCRITEPHFVDDVNHTHHPRSLDHSFNSTLKKRYNEEDKPVYELRSGKVNKLKDGTRVVVKTTRIVQDPSENFFEDLVTNTDAANMMQYEAVPRFKKRPGDIAIEGSNNTLIVLGTDRTGSIANWNAESTTEGFYSGNGGNLPARNEFDQLGYAGSIDIVAGRGMTERTGGTSTSTLRVLDGQEIKKELEKHTPLIKENEGDPDFINDRSRILVSQRTKPDQNFGMSTYVSSITGGVVDSETGDAAVVIKSDKIRLIARSDISFIVTGIDVSETLSSGSQEGRPPYVKESSEFSTYASITIRSDGDIIFSPSSTGVIRLGGADANQAILCTSSGTTVEDGSVKALPIATTGGGFVGTTGGNIDKEALKKSKKPDLGTFSTKVLIK